ncbi:MAG: hypothetical protein HND58_09935 [Planctomycetota bacterium]|nr:MAG: hypothetical protein HND58_09935 [Planctomycetota bacterium]
MKIRILYFEGCPNHRPVVDMVRRLVTEHGLDASVEEREVAPGEEARLRFLGSPTVQVEGVDIEPAARERADFAMSCRVYSTPDGLPSEDMLLTAMGVDATTSRASAPDRSGLLATGGSVLTAILSSACCWLPLLLLAFGASAAGASAFFERWRPLFAGVAIVLLGVGFWSTYLRRAQCSGCECETSRGRAGVLRQMSFWISAVVVTAFVLFPRYAGVVAQAVYPDSGAEMVSAADAELVVHRFDIEGMTCEACATTLEAELRRLPSVSHASVDYATGVAEIAAVRRSAVARVRQAVERHGWRATPE